MKLSDREKNTLLLIARESIEQPLRLGLKYTLPSVYLTGGLAKKAATFVTLFVNGQLKGCIGTLTPCRSLAEDVLENASGAAFEDHRFTPVTLNDLDRLKIEISILTEPVPLIFDDEADLLGKITKDLDGLILKLGDVRATFLPSVWEKLPDKKQFLGQLKKKAGLRPDFWSDRLQFFKYQVEKII